MTVHRPIHFLSCAAVLAAVLLAQTASGGTRPPAIAGQTPKQAGKTELPAKPELLWRYDAGEPVIHAPAAGGGRIYFTTLENDVVAVDLNGRKLWSRKVTRAEGPKPLPEAFDAPLTYVEGALIAVSVDGVVYALDAATGKTLWTYNSRDSIQAAATWYKDSGGRKRVVVINQPSGALHCIDGGTGRKLWTSEGAARTDGPITLGDGLVVFGSCDAAVHGINAEDGEQVGVVTLGEGSEIAGGAAIAGGLVFIGSRSGTLACLDLRKQKQVWVNTDGSGELFTTPAASENKVVVVNGEGNVFCADSRSGKTLWTHRAAVMSPRSPIIVSRRIVLSLDGVLRVLRLDDGAKVWEHAIGGDLTSPVVVDGMIVVGSDEGRVMAFGHAAARISDATNRKVTIHTKQ